MNLQKLVISLHPSCKNNSCEQSAYATWSKPLLQRFVVVFSPQMRPEGASQGGSTNHVFRLVDAFKPAQGAFGLQDPFPTPSQVFLMIIFENLNKFLTNFLLTYVVKTNKTARLVCRHPISNAYNHWLFVAFLNAQCNWLLQWLLPLKSVSLRKSSTQWAIDFSHL